MEIVGQQRNQITELVRGGGKAVQQKQRRLGLFSRFPVENLDTVNVGVMVRDISCLRAGASESEYRCCKRAHGALHEFGE